MCAPATLLPGVSPITGIVAHNRRGYGRLSHITEARSAWPSDRRRAKRQQRLFPRGWRLLSEPSYCRHNIGNLGKLKEAVSLKRDILTEIPWVWTLLGKAQLPQLFPLLM